MNIYRFQDSVDFESAFIISESEESAAEILMKETSLPFHFIRHKGLEEVPKALEFYNETGKKIYINNILPF